MTDFEKLMQALRERQQAYEEARRRSQMARSSENDELNGLNAAQKAVDDAVAEMRKAAPAGSNWSRPTGESVRV